MDDVKEAIEQNLPGPIRERFDELAKDITVGRPEKPILLIDSSQFEKVEEATMLFLKALLSSVGVETTFPKAKPNGGTSSELKARIGGSEAQL